MSGFDLTGVPFSHIFSFDGEKIGYSWITQDGFYYLNRKHELLNKMKVWDHYRTNQLGHVTVLIKIDWTNHTDVELDQTTYYLVSMTPDHMQDFFKIIIHEHQKVEIVTLDQIPPENRKAIKTNSDLVHDWTFVWFGVDFPYQRTTFDLDAQIIKNRDLMVNQIIN
jgi:hypothetical protein